MARVVDGSKVARRILGELQAKISTFGLKPKLVVFLIGKNPAAGSYVRIKTKRAEEIGVAVKLIKYPPEAVELQLVTEIHKENEDPNVTGILVQLPLPQQLDREKILNAIDPSKDVDCLTETNKLKLAKMGEMIFYPPAAAAVLEILDYHQVDLSKGNILLIGTGELVGKPLSNLLLRRQVSFNMANRSTPNFAELVSDADIIITGAGVTALVTGDMVKQGVVVIDAGTTGSELGEMSGDVDFESVSKKASLISPVPGGVGPVTVAMLLRNVTNAAFDKNVLDK